MELYLFVDYLHVFNASRNKHGASQSRSDDRELLLRMWTKYESVIY